MRIKDESVNDVSWPVWTLEMTPSSGTSESYPLEVGVACWTAPTASITTWSTPINPSATTDWPPPPQAYVDLAGMTMTQIGQGLAPEEIARQLNDIFMASTVYGRGGTVDVHLANRLNLAAKVWPGYNLRTWRDICDRHPERASGAWDIVRASDGNAARKAAGTMRGIAHVLGYDPSCRSVPTMAVSLPI